MCTLGACVVLEILLYFLDLRFDDDGIESLVMEDDVSTPVTTNIVGYEPFVVVLEPPLVVPESISDFAEETVVEHDDITQLLGSMEVYEETEESIDDRIQVILSHTLYTTPFFFGNALYVCLNEPFT